MKPGIRVASPRLITVAPGGVAMFEPTALTRVPSITITAGEISVSLAPSNKREALRTVVWIAGVCEKASAEARNENRIRMFHGNAT